MRKTGACCRLKAGAGNQFAGKLQACLGPAESVVRTTIILWAEYRAAMDAEFAWESQVFDGIVGL